MTRDLTRPYAEDRDFRAYFIESDESLGSLLEFIPKHRLTQTTDIPSEYDTQLVHSVYRSPTKLRGTYPEYEAGIKSIYRGKTVYNYDMYVFRWSVRRGKAISVLAAPLPSMAAALLGQIQQASMGSGLKYLSVDLQGLVDRRDNIVYSDDVIKLSGVRMALDGQAPAESLELKGFWSKSIIATTVFREVLKLGDIGAKPDSLRLVHENPELRPFPAGCRRDGRFRFPIGARCVGLVRLQRIFNILRSERLVTAQTVVSGVSHG